MPDEESDNTPARRVSIFLPALYSGGAERSMLNLAEGIAHRGHIVDLVLAQTEGPYLSQVSDDVRIVDLGVGALRGRRRLLSTSSTRLHLVSKSGRRSSHPQTSERP